MIGIWTKNTQSLHYGAAGLRQVSQAERSVADLATDLRSHARA
jgi:hypothetical protein